MIALLIGGGLGLLTVLIVYFISVKLDQKKERKRSGSDDKKQKKKNDKNKKSKNDNGIEYKIGFKTIQNNMVENHDGTISCIIEYSTQDIGALKDEETELFEDQLNSFALSLKEPIKIITLIGKATYRKSNEKIYETINSGKLSKKSIDYSVKLAEELQNKQYDRKQYEKKKYIVIGARDKSDKQKIRLLKQRATIIINNLTRAKIDFRILETIEIIDFLNEYINHGSRYNLVDAEQKGIFELYSTSDMKVGGGDSNE
ncbi:hypothetical protein SH1V18_47890 [Vallitalea longa]|uniref:Uncharacterized protein n=1 Tax=Vallitalea longa TaxID=2936439 RepID=A0A9W5YFW4_9FIRM|nr:hypothetical protein [Vallitalea longa]GKX32309.1 hypothetical protein SH1V18_47890 [Vallitalea longa]